MRISACGLLVTVVSVSVYGEVLDTFFFVGLRSSLITSLLVRGQKRGNDYFHLSNVLLCLGRVSFIDVFFLSRE